MRLVFRRQSRHLNLVSLKMGTWRWALIGRMAISLYEEAAPLERNRTGWDGGMEGGMGTVLGGSDQSGTVGPGQAQKLPLSYFVCQLGLHC